MKTIIITGGSQGLGLAIAKKLVSANNVYIISRDENRLKAASKELNCRYKVCDVTNYSQVESTVKEIIKESSKIDVLINNAGLWIEGKLEDNNYKDIKTVVETNTLGPIFMAKAVLPTMKKNNSGIILNINSQAGINAKAERAVYNASKWAITGFTKSMFQEEIKNGIKVMGFYPALMDTTMFEKIGINKNMKGAIKVDDAAKVVEFMISQKEEIVLPEVGMMNTNY